MKKITGRVLRQLNTPQLITLGFAGVIFVGTVFLLLPWATMPGKETTFLDALFTATTSVCVTGLVTVTTATQWTMFGKIIILLLIQFGGLGVITVSTLILMVARRRIGLKSRRIIQESYNLEGITGMVSIIRRVLLVTLLVEGIGAVGYAFCFIPEMGLWKGLWNAIFTAISAFCNAGIDVLGENSLVPYVTHAGVNLVTMFLIISGGLGFTVWFDLKKGTKEIIKEKHSVRYAVRGLSLHSKLALTATGIFLVGGTLFFFIFEYHNPGTIGNLSFGDKLLASAFQSVTTRTAGFLTIDQAALTDASLILTIFLMLVGGSPMGTAGGLKTTTIAILILGVYAYLRGKSDVEVFHRKLKEENTRTAIVVSSIGMITLFIGIIALTTTVNAPLSDLVYEAASAIGTVGLTRGATAQLNGAGKLIIILCMYLGRIGPLTLATAITARARRVNKSVHLAEERILIG